MAGLPPEAVSLLALDASEFVAERRKLARELRDAGRTEDAQTVAALRKPSAVVLAVNRAARDRPQVALDAAEAARRVAQALAGDMDGYATSTSDLQRALDLLSEVALAHVAGPGKSPTEAMRRRVRELLRNAVADEAERAALVRGALTAEREPAGFSAVEGMPVHRRARVGRPRKAVANPADKRRAEEAALRKDLARAEEELREAERAVGRAEHERARAERAAAAIRAKIARP